LSAAGAGELIAEGVLAIEMAALASDVAMTIHPHPTLSETVMESAEVFFGTSTQCVPPQARVIWGSKPCLLFSKYCLSHRNSGGLPATLRPGRAGCSAAVTSTRERFCENLFDPLGRDTPYGTVFRISAAGGKRQLQRSPLNICR